VVKYYTVTAVTTTAGFEMSLRVLCIVMWLDWSPN